MFLTQRKDAGGTPALHFTFHCVAASF